MANDKTLALMAMLCVMVAPALAGETHATHALMDGTHGMTYTAKPVHTVYRHGSYWVWTSKGLARCVERVTGSDGNPKQLSPR